MQKRNLLVIFLALAIFSISTNSCYAKKAKKRPTVAVVLSGGGAKGMAHIGALEVIKKVGIPIDYYVGTSMGAIIGGLSSIGYSPEQLDSMVRIQNWSMLLSDRIPRVNQNIQDRETAEKYIISVPFAMKMKLPQGGGLIKGQNLDNLFSELTIGYHDSLDFNKLPVPFACVSDNIVNGKEVNFHSGVLSQAMRASMAIPGVFTPVRMDSMVLVDGGVINNYPVNVAKAMGADYIIGIDVQSNLKPASELGTAPSILGQLINLMGEEMYKKNLKQSDVVIKVDVKGYSAASFTPEAIDTLIRRGREAGDKQLEALFELKRTLGLDSTFIPTPPNEYPYSNDRKVFVRKVIFDGYHIREKKWLLKECNLKENSEIDVRVIEQAATMLCANMGYASATFTLPQSQEGGYNLVFNLTKRHERMVNVGFRFDSEDIASILINYTNNFNTIFPTSLSVTARLGKMAQAKINYGVETAPLKLYNFSYSFKYNDINFYNNGIKTHNSTFRYHSVEATFTDLWMKNIKFTGGLRYELYDYSKALFTEGFEIFNIKTEHFYDYFVNLHYDSFDKAYFPSKGISTKGSFHLYTDNFVQYNDKTPFSSVDGTFESVIPISSRFSIMPFVGGRFVFGADIPYSKMNVMGGDISEKYLQQQLPFIGINNVEIMDNSLLIGSLKFRQRMGSIHYLSFTTNYAFSGHKIKELFNSKTMFGCGICYGIDSMFGPLEASLNYANHADEVSMYINLGYKF